MHRLIRNLLTCSLLALALPAVSAQGAEAKPDGAVWGRHYDLRLTLPAVDAPASDPAQSAAIARWRAGTPGLLLDREARTGAVRSIANAGGYLSGPRPGSDSEALALAFLRQELDLLGLDPADLDDYEVTNVVPSRATGLTHLYLRQRHAGIPVYGGQLQINLKGDGRVLSVHNQFLPHLAAAVNGAEPMLSVPEAVASLTAHLRADPAELIDHSASARLMYLPIRAGEARLVWNFQVETADSQHWYDVTVDAADGRVWTRIDWVAADTYKVYEIPVESPNHTSPLPPADGRTSQVNPANATASPFGWHDTNGVAGAELTITQGNNVQAYTDTDANNTPDPGSSPDGGALLDFTFPLDLTLAPSGYRPAAVANLFYWNNVQHDVLYQFGFDEAAGNFQVNNYGNGGLGNDSVQAEAQDGSGTNNANFSTPVDGSRPRMQMYIWTAPTPDRDGDLDNGIILHEYGHGVSNRLTGGPGNVSCLGNAEQMGEGWSDWMTVYFTALASHTATTNRGVGTYALNQATTGVGIRPAPYNTDMTVNSYTYSNLPTMAVPHGVGFVWNTMLWQMYWALVGQYGFDADLYNGTGGNNLAMQLVIDGMKLQPCSPGFVDGRNAILAADTALTGGVNQCLIWGAFAVRGLGFSAAQGSSSSASDGTAAFDLPSVCGFGNAGTDAWVCATDSSHVQNLFVGPLYTSPPVDMSVTGNPAGTTTLFSQDPVATVPASITLTVGNLGAVAAGTYNITVAGDDGVDTGSDIFALTVDVGAAPATTLLSPADNATAVGVQPTLTWTAVATAQDYLVEVSVDPTFAGIDYSATVAGTSHQLATPLAPVTHYYWRVSAGNGCGSTASGTFDFVTANIVTACAGPITIVDNASATPYPSVATVAGVVGTILGLDVQLNGLTHTYPDDIDMLLVSPSGEKMIFFSDVGGSGNVSAINLTLSDGAATLISDAGQLASGTFRPSDVEAGDTFPAPAPAGPYSSATPVGAATFLNTFGAATANGGWNLYVRDDAGVDVGTLTQWCVSITAAGDMPFLDGFELGDTSRWSLTVP